MLDGKSTHKIMLVDGIKGMGKTWTLKLIFEELKKITCKRVYIDFSQFTIFDSYSLGQRFINAFGEDDFRPASMALDSLGAIQIQIRGGDASRPAMTLNDTQTGDNTFGDVANTIFKENTFAPTLNSNSLRIMERRFNAAFEQCLEQVSARMPVIFLFDTYELNTTRADEWRSTAIDHWITTNLLEKIRDGKYENVFVVISGRIVPRYGAEWGDIAIAYTLTALSLKYVAEYLEMKRGINWIKRSNVSLIYQGCDGEPLLMAKLADNLLKNRRPPKK